MSQYFYFGTCETVFGIEIYQTESMLRYDILSWIFEFFNNPLLKGFVLFCSCLFLIGFVSEFISFVKLCFGKILVNPGDKKSKTSKSKIGDDKQASLKHKSSYNSFEMTVPTSQSDTISVNSSKSLVSMCDRSPSISSSSSSTDMPTGFKSSSPDNNNNNNNTLLASYSTHLDLIKFHPADLVTNLQLIQSLSRINRSTYTK